MNRCASCNAILSERSRYCSECGQERYSDTSPRLKPTSPLAERDETVQWSGSFSALGLIHSWLLAILITIVLPVGGLIVRASFGEMLVLGGIVLAVWCGLAILLGLQKLNVHYELTNHRLLHRSGILLRRTNRIELIDMNDVSHEQGIIERFFDVGTIEVTSSDRSHPVIRLPGIANVEKIAMLIDDARLQERSRRGVHIEQL